MGYDANRKSDLAERRQRFIMIVSLVALASACIVVTSLLRSAPPLPPAPSNSLAQAQKLAQIHKAAATSSDNTKPNGEDASKPWSALRAGGDITPDSIGTTNFNKDPNLEKGAAENVAKLDEIVRAIKKTGVIMEADEHSLQEIAKLQRATRELIKLRYGDIGRKNYRIRMDLEFQPTIPDFAAKGKGGSLLIELAPISLIPCSVFNFLEIARTWKNGAFHRNAGHVLQALARSDITKPMPFQEYSKEYPHKKGTLGYAGRPSGPEFYISTQDNTQNHGPGSQQKHNPYEADSIIGTVIEGMDDVVPRIHTMPGKEFIGDKAKWVLIRRMHILVPGDGPDGYVELSQSPLELPSQ